MLTRRDFLFHSAVAGLAASQAAAPGALASLLAADAMWRPRYAICNETFEGWDQPQIFRFLSDCGYAGVEIAPYTIQADVRRISAPERESLRKAADEAGIQIVALH